MTRCRRRPSIPTRVADLVERVEVRSQRPDQRCLAGSWHGLRGRERRDGDEVLSARRRRLRELRRDPQPVGLVVEDHPCRPARIVGQARPPTRGASTSCRQSAAVGAGVNDGTGVDAAATPGRSSKLAATRTSPNNTQRRLSPVNPVTTNKDFGCNVASHPQDASGWWKIATRANHRLGFDISQLEPATAARLAKAASDFEHLPPPVLRSLPRLCLAARTAPRAIFWLRNRGSRPALSNRPQSVDDMLIGREQELGRG